MHAMNMKYAPQHNKVILSRHIDIVALQLLCRSWRIKAMPLKSEPQVRQK